MILDVFYFVLDVSEVNVRSGHLANGLCRKTDIMCTDPTSMTRLLTFLLALLFTNLIASDVTQRLSEGWEHYQGTLGSPWEVWRGEAASDNVTWSKVKLPHCFNGRDAVDPDVRYYQGPGWYRSLVKIANPYPNGRTLLHFDGAGQKSQVFVNTDKVGEHLGGYDQWTVDITEAAAKAMKNEDYKGQVPISVMCDNSRDAESIPSDLSDFNRYGGLYRHVSLVYVPEVSMERVQVDAKPEGVKLSVRLYNPSSIKGEIELNVEVRDAKDNVVHTARTKFEVWSGGKVIDSFSIEKPELWSPKTPSLYRCVVTLGEQIITERFGIRSTEWVDNGPFKLNGERLLLKGTHYHEDHTGVAAAVPDDVVRKTLKMIKDMGANFVRLGHYQQAPLVLELCDELGLLVWEEVPWCRGGIGGASYQKQVKDMLRAMIDQHRNHPSIIMWGMGNENDWPGDFEVFDKEKIRALMKELNDLSHELDPSRPTCIRRCDFCKDIVDIYSPSIWAGWYSGRYTEYKTAAEKALKETKHFFHAEWGGDSHAHRFAEDPEQMVTKVETGKGTAEKGKAYKGTGGKVRMSKDGDWSESYMCNLFDWHLKEQEDMPWLTGSAAWIFKDFATPLRPENPVPRVNQKGVVERDGTPKETYYVFQSYWSKKPMLHIFGHGWPVRWGTAGEEKEVLVYSNCPEVELFVNGKSVGVKKRNVSDYPAAGLHWMVKLSEGENKLRAVSKELSDELTVGYQTKKWSKPAKLKLEEIAQKDGIATMEVRMLDTNDIPCLDCSNIVRFGIAGDGRLIDNLGTSTGSRVVQLYNGRATIQCEITNYKVCVSVSSEGRKPQFKYITDARSPATGAEKSKAESKVLIGPQPSLIPKLKLDVAAIDKDRILKAATAALNQAPVTITTFPAKLSEGGPNDFYSNGDYWWPDPKKPNGLPYIKRDGETNPENFVAHRMAVKTLRDSVAALAAAYKINHEDNYVTKAAELLKVFFLDAKTRMNPSLNFAQAVPGVSPGRGIGIIDTLHIIEIPAAIKAIENSKAFPVDMAKDLRQWFRELAEWMTTSKNGNEEANAKNNHAVAFHLQLAVFSDFIGDEEKLDLCRTKFKEVFVGKQMAEDGSFPLELARTKPYGYSIFQLDNMTLLCHVLSTADDNLWTFETNNGKSIAKAIGYLYPFLADKSKWTLPPDVNAWEGWPARQPNLIFGGFMLGEQKYLDLWQNLPSDPIDPEVQRNIGITQPLLWIQ